MTDFEERSGRITQKTEWGNWSQSLHDVTIEVDLEKGTRGKDVNIQLLASSIHCTVKNSLLLKGSFCEPIVTDESTWTIEDQNLLRIYLYKSGSSLEFWPSLLRDQYEAEPQILQQMRRKIDLEKFQVDHPGLDFSGASIDKKY